MRINFYIIIGRFINKQTKKYLILNFLANYDFISIVQLFQTLVKICNCKFKKFIEKKCTHSVKEGRLGRTDDKTEP